MDLQTASPSLVSEPEVPATRSASQVFWTSDQFDNTMTYYNTRHPPAAEQAQSSTKREANGSIDDRPSKQSRLATALGIRGVIQHKIANIEQRTIESIENQTNHCLQFLESDYMNLAKIIASPPATFPEIINESLALAKGYTRERYAIMEPYWKVVSEFKGQGVAERQAKEIYETHPVELVTLLEALGLDKYQSPSRNNTP